MQQRLSKQSFGSRCRLVCAAALRLALLAVCVFVDKLTCAFH